LREKQNISKKGNNELKNDHWVPANELFTNYSKINFMLINNQNNIHFAVSINDHPNIKTKCYKNNSLKQGWAINLAWGSF